MQTTRKTWQWVSERLYSTGMWLLSVVGPQLTFCFVADEAVQAALLFVVGTAVIFVVGTFLDRTVVVFAELELEAGCELLLYSCIFLFFGFWLITISSWFSCGEFWCTEMSCVIERWRDSRLSSLLSVLVARVAAWVPFCLFSCLDICGRDVCGQWVRN